MEIRYYQTFVCGSDMGAGKKFPCSAEGILDLAIWWEFDLFVQYQSHNMFCLGVIGVPFTQSANTKPYQPPIMPDSLSDKEKEILNLYTQGIPWIHIATQLGIAVKTVRLGLISIRSKMRKLNTTQE